MKSILSLLLLLLAVRLAPAAEGKPPAPSMDVTNAMLITCDDGFEYLAGKAVYRGNVQVLDGEMALNCELLTVYFQTNLGKIDLIVAETNVFITQKDSLAIADKAVFTATNDVVTLTGNVLLDDPQGWLAVETFVYDRKTGGTRSIGRVIMGSHPRETNSFAIPLPRSGPGPK